MNEINLEYFEKAVKWNIKYEQELKKNELHCRGNLKSVSLISLNKETPEKGFSSIKSENILTNRLNRIDEIKKPKRATGEKLLQARIINEALYKNNHYLPFGNKIKFITSELALQNSENKIVNDILGFSDDGELYIIELKSLRSKTELTKQVNDFEKFVISNDELFFNILNIYGHKWDKNKTSIKKAIVWNKLNNKKVFDKEIIEFVYDKALLESDESILKIDLLDDN
ncbi:MAG: hypothetical protein U9N59_10290 [Campylobacterota bacterium]|nr:hypothetical protein [Campylobacterota bacterium]